MSLEAIAVATTTGTKPAGLVVVLHGWGANAKDLASLVPLLNLNKYQFLFPNAPFPHPYTSVGRMWYDLSSQEYQGIHESRQILKDWLLSLEASTGIPLSRTILSGFSQGAAMTLDVGLGLPLAGLIALSGYMHPLSQSLDEVPPVLIVHGKQDTVVPLKAAQYARDNLIALGVAVQYQEFDMGHEIRPEVLPLIQQFVTARSEERGVRSE
ncbi:MAG: Carboxylesterase 2 [Chroococcidiopsis sp. SAG 2025]|uniref:alpha/beta hydrolase n=1 Tax=Chroococcidiopsis sp. SAG 2025 TaxID=171389 RepID=UPI00293721CA|nr:alpha/beta hydrolase [Chroococcidiopsis sp. SAG 2025]MDV2992910.1 Carboxylesterase 2 [Chroococcidiopsis sp. SAG 2025]